MGVNMFYTECTFKPHDILKVKYKHNFIMCAQNKSLSSFAQLTQCC